MAELLAAGPPRDRDPVRRHPGLGRPRPPPLLPALVRAHPRLLDRGRPRRHLAAPGSSAATRATAMTAFFLAEHGARAPRRARPRSDAGREIVELAPGRDGARRAQDQRRRALGRRALPRPGRHRRPARGDRARRRGQRVRAHPADRARRRRCSPPSRSSSGSTPSHAQDFGLDPLTDHLPHGRRAPRRDREGGARRRRRAGRQRAAAPGSLPPVALGIITGSGTYSLPGFEGTGPEPVATDGATRSSRAARSRASRCCTSRATARATCGSPTTSRTRPTRRAEAARRGRGDRGHGLRRGRPGRRARLADLLRRPALPRQPAPRRLAVHVPPAGRPPRRGHWIYDDPYSPALRAALLAGAAEAG